MTNFNFLTYIRDDHKNKYGQKYCLYKCICGNEKIIREQSVKYNKTKSCGCISKAAQTHRIKDLTNQKFGKLLVIFMSEKRVYGRIAWHCRCECGNECVVASNILTSGKRCSCGCLLKQPKRPNLIGQKFHSLKVVDELGILKDNSKNFYWLCECDCGNFTQVNTTNLRKGYVKTCGCSHHRTGVDNPHWNHDKTNYERKRERSYPGYNDWRTKVLKRDNFICVICESEANIAHHLNGHHWAKNERLLINNGISLCNDCHKDFHQVYGNKHNTKKQFEEFKQNKRDNK